MINRQEKLAMSFKKIANQFFEKKLGGNFVFWAACGAAYFFIALIGAFFYPTSKLVAPQVVIADMTAKIDGKFLIVVLVAAFLVIVTGSVVQAILIKTRGGTEIISTALDSGISQFLSAGSIIIVTTAVSFMPSVFSGEETHQFMPFFLGFGAWLIAFFVYWVLARLGAIKIDHH